MNVMFIGEYKKYMKQRWKKFKCKHCGNCCIGYRPTPSSDVYNLALYLGITVDETVEWFFGKIVYIDGEKMVKKYSIKKNEPCPFLAKNDMCIIHPVKPLGCRLFPLETDLGTSNINCLGYKDLKKLEFAEEENEEEEEWSSREAMKK